MGSGLMSVYLPPHRGATGGRQRDLEAGYRRRKLSCIENERSQRDDFFVVRLPDRRIVGRVGYTVRRKVTMDNGPGVIPTAILVDHGRVRVGLV